MLLFELEKPEGPELSGVVESFLAFAFFALNALLLTFGKATLPVFLIGFASAAVTAVFSKKYGFLFPGLMTLLLFYRYSDRSDGNNVLSLTAFAGNVLCLIPVCLRFFTAEDTFQHLIREFRIKLEEGRSLSGLLLLLAALLVIRAFLPLFHPKSKNDGVLPLREPLLFGTALVLTAAVTIGYGLLFAEDYVSLLLLFAWLFLLVLLHRDRLFFRKTAAADETA